MHKYVIFSVMLLVISLSNVNCSFAENKDESSTIDLSQPLSSSSPCVPEECAPEIENLEAMDYQTLDNRCYPHMISIPSFAATCITAPSFFEGNWKTVNSIEINELITNCVVIDVSSVTDLVTDKEIKEFEKKHGNIPPKSFIIFHTGWSKKYWKDSKNYTYNFPTISVNAANYLVEKEIVGVGVDTPSIDNKKQKFATQELLFTKGKFIVKNLSSKIEEIPATGIKIIIAPMKFEGCNESPARIFAIIEKKEKGILERISSIFTFNKL